MYLVGPPIDGSMILDERYDKTDKNRPTKCSPLTLKYKENLKMKIYILSISTLKVFKHFNCVHC